ncbi:glycerophosphate transferase [Heyndrickxia sporothermodurans]|nr:glycerophosphate transferase [Heyndrickxia sporothermodurans]
MYNISVIIPTYNASSLILDTLESVKNQTFSGKVEIICIDDCSEDDTVEVIKNYKNKTGMRIKLLQQKENKRQGAARNRGLKEASGEFIFFLDSDDFLDENAFEFMYNKAKLRDCDFVLCDWAYYYEDRGEVYVNNDLFLFEEWLNEAQCENLYQAQSYFSVNKLYKKDFLINNQIKFGEGYIYEDFEFYIDVVQKAKNIGIVSNPFYKVRVNLKSTTKSNSSTTIHMDNFLKAVDKTLSLFNPRNRESIYMVYKYFFDRAQIYSENRIPRRYKRVMIKKTIEILNKWNRNYYVPKNIVLFNQLYFHKKLIQNNKINTIMLVRSLQKKGKLNKCYNKYTKAKNVLKKILFIEKLKESKWNKKRRQRAVNLLKTQYRNAPLKKDTVLFLGFDYRYIGNSKYLFDYLRQNYSYLNIRFITKNQSVPSKYRIKPRSLEFWKALGESKIFITESWTPLAFYKKEGSFWFQLWHGTPYKRLFFDSHEKFISKYNRNHKRDKKKDINKWDYLLADSDGGKRKFKTAFSIQSDRILSFGYPRVQWLKDNKENNILKNEIRAKLNISYNKKVILYAPTWRDYNYKSNNPNFNYLINLEELVTDLGEDFVIIAKLHSMEKQNLAINNIIIPSDNIETQELLLISDTLISDYSSIIFDVFAIDKNVLLYINDEEEFTASRGAYDDMKNLLKPLTFNSVEGIVNQIKCNDNEEFHHFYEKIKKEYSNIYQWNSNEKIAEMIVDCLEKN